MTIASTTSKVSYNGSGSVGPFYITFPFIKNADIVATKVSTTGVETVLTLTTHYTLTGAGDASGGALTLVSALASGEKIIIKRSPAQVQETEYTEGSDFPAASHEAALDLLTMQTQDLQEQLARAVLVDISSSTSPADLLDELETDVAAAAASASAASTSAGTATTQAGVATTQAGLAAGSAGDASDSASLAQEWATNPEDDAVTGYPGEYSALHWAAKAAEAASGGAFKVSADDTTPGYLESKLTLISNSGLVMATTSPAGNEVRTIGVDLAADSGLVIGAGGLTVEATASNAVFSATSRVMGRATAGAGVGEELTLSQVLDFIGSAASGDILYRGASAWARLAKGADTNVLTLAAGLPSWAAPASSGEWAYVAKDTAVAASKSFTGLNSATYDYKFIFRALYGSAAYPFVQIGTGAGPTYVTTGYINYAQTTTALAVTADSAATSGIALTGTTYTANTPYAGEYIFVSDDSFPTFTGTGSAIEGYSGTPTVCRGGGTKTGAGTFTALKVLCSSGNVGGTVELWRRAKQ